MFGISGCSQLNDIALKGSSLVGPLLVFLLYNRIKAVIPKPVFHQLVESPEHLQLVPSGNLHLPPAAESRFVSLVVGPLLVFFTNNLAQGISRYAN